MNKVYYKLRTTHTIVATSVPMTLEYPLFNIIWGDVAFNASLRFLVSLHTGRGGWTKATWKSEIMCNPVRWKLVQGQVIAQLVNRPIMGHQFKLMITHNQTTYHQNSDKWKVLMSQWSMVVTPEANSCWYKVSRNCDGMVTRIANVCLNGKWRMCWRKVRCKMMSIYTFWTAP